MIFSLEFDANYACKIIFTEAVNMTGINLVLFRCKIVAIEPSHHWLFFSLYMKFTDFNYCLQQDKLKAV